MKEMLAARKAQLQQRGKKGFTLMELLIVIAIIAILVAIAIPLFLAQLDNAKAASDEANARSIYALAMADYMDNQKYDNTGYGDLSGKGTITIKVGDQDNTFEFSDKTTSLTITGTDASNPSSPTVTLVTNGTTYEFPGNTGGTPSNS